MTDVGVDSEEEAGRSTAPYVFDQADVSTAVAIVDTAFTDLDFGWATVSRVVEAAKAHGIAGTPLETELIHAAGHSLRREVGGKPGCQLGRPELDRIQGWPRPVAETPPDVVRLWREVAAAATAPAAIAHFEDLLFAKRDGNGRQRVRRAAHAYLAAVDAADEVDMAEVDALLRVWSIARAVREPDIDDEIRRRMAAIADDVMTTSPGKLPGVSLPMLSALAVGPVRGPALTRTTSTGCWPERRPSTSPATSRPRSQATVGGGRAAIQRSWS